MQRERKLGEQEKDLEGAVFKLWEENQELSMRNEHNLTPVSLWCTAESVWCMKTNKKKKKLRKSTHTDTSNWTKVQFVGPGPSQGLQRSPCLLRLLRLARFLDCEKEEASFLITPPPWQPFPLSQWVCLGLYCSCSVTQMRSSTVTPNQQEETCDCRITGLIFLLLLPTSILSNRSNELLSWGFLVFKRNKLITPPESGGTKIDQQLVRIFIQRQGWLSWIFNLKIHLFARLKGAIFRTKTKGRLSAARWWFQLLSASSCDLWLVY